MPPVVSLDVDLPSGKYAIAEGANTLVIERIPLALRVSRLQHCEAIFRRKVCLHNREFVTRYLGLHAGPGSCPLQSEKGADAGHEYDAGQLRPDRCRRLLHRSLDNDMTCC